MGTCLICDENFDLDDKADVSDIVTCPRCDSKLEILDIHPVMFDFPESDEDSD